MRSPVVRTCPDVCEPVCYPPRPLSSTALAAFSASPPKKRLLSGAIAAPPNVKRTQSLGLSEPPGQHMEASKLVFNYPTAVVKTAAISVAL